MRNSNRAARRTLHEYFERNGYIRSPPVPGKKGQGHRGYEVRFAAYDRREIAEIVECLHRIGVRPGRPFRKGAAWRLPVYGRAQVAALLDVVDPSLREAAGTAEA